MNQVKLTVRRRFPALARVWQRIRYHPRLAGSPEQVFAEFYRDNKWGDAESVSGAGSNLTQTAEVRRVLPGLLAELGCRSMLDVPCGDFYWMRLVPLDVDYTGGDIVSDIVGPPIRPNMATSGGASCASICCKTRCPRPISSSAATASSTCPMPTSAGRWTTFAPRGRPIC